MEELRYVKCLGRREPWSGECVELVSALVKYIGGRPWIWKGWMERYWSGKSVLERRLVSEESVDRQQFDIGSMWVGGS